jgi:protein-S-isoprenylcysteine O-methyltransferase Ste14
MRPLAYVWPYALMYWLAFAWCYAPEFFLNRRAKSLSTAQDAGSFRFVMSIQVVAIAAAFSIASISRFGVLSRPRLWFWVGVSIMIAGSWLRRHCFRMLGPSFTAVVVVRPDQAVVDRGAYRWVRHPSYTAGALMLVGMILALGNWVSVSVIITAVILAYGYRVRVEESALVATLGDPYRAYMRRTKRFIPLVI